MTRSEEREEGGSKDSDALVWGIVQYSVSSTRERRVVADKEIVSTSQHYYSTYSTTTTQHAERARLKSG